MGNQKLYFEKKLLEKNMKQINAKLGAEILVCAIGGSLSFNLHNHASDLDVYAIINSPCLDLNVVIKTICIQGQKFDFMCVSYSALKKYSEGFDVNAKQYPTCFFRSEEENEAVKRKKDVKRDDFPREIVQRIYISGQIMEFKEGNKQLVYETLKPTLSLMVVWNDYFIRARGNYNDFIKGKDEVALRKYLYTISELYICTVLLHEEWVDIDFTRLVVDNNYFIGNVKCIVEELYQWNRESGVDKTSKLIKSNQELNIWIEQSLEKILNEFEKNKEIIANKYLALQ